MESGFQATERDEGKDGRSGLAILGGVFDPVHNAHLVVARAALARLPVSEVVFLPAGRPPHKAPRHVAAPAERLRMLELAVTGEPGLRIDRRELERDGPSYTILSLEELAREVPGRRLYFLIGSDNISDIGRWHRAREVLELCTPVVVARAETPAEFLPEHLPWLDAERIRALNALRLPVAPLAISSSDIRARVARGEEIGGLVPPPVAEHIRRAGLYRRAP